MRKVYADELYHYGVKGMKWGVRRARSKSGLQAAEKAYKETMNNMRGVAGSRYERVQLAERAGRKAYKETVKNEKEIAKVKKNESIKRGKELSQKLTDRSQIRWNEDYNNRLINKMSKKDWDDVKAYERDNQMKELAFMSLSALAGVGIVSLMESRK